LIGPENRRIGGKIKGQIKSPESQFNFSTGSKNQNAITQARFPSNPHFFPKQTEDFLSIPNDLMPTSPMNKDSISNFGVSYHVVSEFAATGSNLVSIT